MYDKTDDWDARHPGPLPMSDAAKKAAEDMRDRAARLVLELTEDRILADAIRALSLKEDDHG